MTEAGQDRTVSEAVAEGRRVRAELLGESQVAGGRGPADVLAPDLGTLSDSALWGTVWARPGLELRTKSLVTLAALMTLGRDRHLRIHLRGARNLGLTKEELADVAVQLTFYIGLPMVHNALAAIAEVFSDEMPA